MPGGAPEAVARYDAGYDVEMDSDVAGVRKRCQGERPRPLRGMMQAMTWRWTLMLLAVAPLFGQAVEIRVDAGVKQGAYRPIYSYFGYDEPNYTYSANGKKLIGELTALSPVRTVIRTHHLLITGDGTPAM